jgi:3-methyladenine DNA glycosylase/8-oxoguanine DNA glycosylase
MFSLGRADVFAPGDLALRDAAQRLFGLEARPRRKGAAHHGRAAVALALGGGPAALGVLPSRARARARRHRLMPMLSDL